MSYAHKEENADLQFYSRSVNTENTKKLAAPKLGVISQQTNTRDIEDIAFPYDFITL